MSDTDTPWTGEFLAVERRGRWEYARRVNDVTAAVILAIDEDSVILVEQERVPLGRRCLELPAGLVGDDVAGEAVERAAARELEEETGYRAGHIEVLGEFASSPGMVSETFTLVRATKLTRHGAGGGVDGEDITVHRVALGDMSGFVAARRAAGVAIDVKLLLLLASDYLKLSA